MEYSGGEDNPLENQMSEKKREKTLKRCIFFFPFIEFCNNTIGGHKSVNR